MDWLLGALEKVGLVCLAVIVLCVVVLLVRRQVIISHGGVFDCGLRKWRDEEPGGWALGMARYSGNLFKWYRMFALIPRHSLQLSRDDMRVTGTRRMDAIEALQLFDDQVVVELAPTPDGVRRDLSLSRQSLVGLSSWLESAPVGHRFGAS